MKILRWVLFIGLFFMPLLDGGVHIAGYRLLLFNLYSTLLIAVALIVLPTRRRLRPRQGLTNIYLVVFALSCLIASIGAVRSDIALFGALKNLQLLFFALILAFSVKKIEDIRFYMFGMLGGVAWVSAIGWVQSLLGNNALLIRANLQVNALNYSGIPGLYGTRTVTAFDDPIMSGHFLAVGFCMALGWALGTKNRQERIWLSILAVVALVPLLTSGSRGPIFAAILTGSTLIFFFAIKKKRVFLFIPFGMFLALFSQDIFRFIDAAGIFNVFLDRFRYGFASTRWEYWAEVISMAKSYPFGTGIGNFAYVAPKYIPGDLLYIMMPDGTYVTNTHSESMYFTQLIENGWLGFLAFLGVVSSSLFYGLKLFLNSKQAAPGIERSIRAGMLGAWMSMALSMISTYGYNNAGIAVLFWFLVGLSMISQHRLHLISIKRTVRTV